MVPTRPGGGDLLSLNVVPIAPIRMSLWVAVGLFLVGLAIVIVAAEQLVEATAGLSQVVGVSPFLLSVIFLGFDPENLAVGSVASYEMSPGIALGTIVGSAMVALALALGITALIVPLQFDRVPRQILLVTVAPILLVTGLAVDGVLSRVDGGLLLLAYGAGVVALVRWERQNICIRTGDPEDVDVEQFADMGLARAVAWFVASLVGVVVGSEALLRGARPVIGALGWSDTLFGMAILALLISIEEVARELPAAIKGRPEITLGNVVGSILTFFCFNAGVIALVRPVPVEPVSRWFYFPVCAGTILVIAALLLQRSIPRWAGGVLVLLYIVFVVGPFIGGF